MSGPAERMRLMRTRRRAAHVRELRLLVPDARMRAVRQRVARQSAALKAESEQAALDWIEAVSEFDEAR
jgi:hypothetical protein